MVSLIDQQSYAPERQLLAEVFQQELRDGQLVWIYHYDQRYYKVLSACAKLRLKTKNLPEGNPTFIEVKDTDWQQIINTSGATDAPSPAPSHQPPTQEQSQKNFAYQDFIKPSFDTNAPLQQEFVPPQPSPIQPTFVQPYTQQHHVEAPKQAVIQRIDPKESMRRAEEAHQQSIHTRETSLKTREESIRVREHAVKEREKAIVANDQDLNLLDETLSSKEQRQESRQTKLDYLKGRLDSEAAKLLGQKDEIRKLADHLDKASRNLMTEDL
jgi:hypothetical protein